MATIITSECINCGACEPECPNTAIYQGGVEWEHKGQTHPALSDEIFYIVPEKCTECVGFYDHEACAAVCPVDCCVPDPNRPESEEALMVRAKELHPETTFPEDFPSRFKKAAAEAAPPPVAAAPAPTNGAAQAAPAAAVRVAAAGPAAMPGGRVERPLPRQHPVALAPVAAPRGPKQFPGELPEDFEAVLAAVLVGESRGRRLVRWLINLAQPVLGAASDAPKRQLERVVSDRRVFTAARATVRNSMLNMVLYPSVLAAIGVAGGREFFSAQMKGLIFLGVSVAAVEWMLRMRESIFRGVPAGEGPLRGSLYALLGNVLIRPLMAMSGGESRQSRVAFDGFYDARFDDKTERERRYGEVYRIEDLSGGYFLRLEFPTRVPPSSLGDELGLPERMPDYDYDIALQNGHLVVSGKVVDPRVLKLTAVAGAFPPEFTTRVTLGRPVAGFRHRYRDKVLEVALPTRR